MSVAAPFELSTEHEAFRKVMRQFAEAEIAPHAATWDREHRFPEELVPKMGDLGLFALPFPEEIGGGGGDLTSLCIAIEEIGRVDQSIGITLEAAVGLGINPIVAYGTTEQRRTVAAGPLRRAGAGRLRVDRARCRLRCRRHPHQGDARR